MHPQALSQGWQRPSGRTVRVFLLCTCLLFGHQAFGENGPAHERSVPAWKKPWAAKGAPHERPGAGPPTDIPVRGRPIGDERCPVDAREIAEFANGEQYHYGALVTALTSPSCMAQSRELGLAAMSYGVNFSVKAPYRLDGFAQALAKNDLESARYMETSLARSIPGLLRTNPLGSSELLPLLGQLTILSPDAARSMLATIIRQEISAGQQRLSNADRRGQDLIAAELARTLVKLGANESALATKLADDVEEMALLAESSSLGEYFRGLAAAAGADPSLVPTLNVSAGAFSRGVVRGKALYRKRDKNALLVALFESVRAMLGQGEVLEVAAGELDRGLAALIGGERLTDTSLRLLWRSAMRVLAQTRSQEALADAVASSLTPKIVFLSAPDLELVLGSARNYAQIAGAVQANFLLSWRREWEALQQGKTKVAVFNRMREKYFEPLVAEILEFDPAWIDPYWVDEVLLRNLVEDELIEKRFPRLVLAHLNRREGAVQAAAVEDGPEPIIASFAENFAVLWSINRVHLPALSKWVRKYDR
jgi:hypothetical protein